MKTSNDIPVGPLSSCDLIQQWNAQADESNQWESLETCEQLAWAQACAIAADRNRHPTTPPAPEPGEVGELVEMLTQEAGSLEAYCNKIANGECRTLDCFVRGGYVRSVGFPTDPSVATCPQLEKAAAMRRAATLFSQQSAPAPAVVPVAVDLKEKDFDAEGRCWHFMPGLPGLAPEWRLIRPVELGPFVSHIAPFHAIPLPQAGEVQP